MKTKVILVGGFLGAGKTTLLFEAAKKLSKQQGQVGLITNDQAAELVDTAWLKYTAGATTEVSGSCFCCNFDGFSAAIDHLITEQQAAIILAEPVGSCTDLSATLLQPLKHLYGKHYTLAPLSVLADPIRLKELLEQDNASGLHPSAAYILEKQLEEADEILISKADLLSTSQADALLKQATDRWPQASVRLISAKTGLGLDQWLDEMMERQGGGHRLAQVDYDIYAEGEACLGWLNTTLQLKGQPTDWNAYAQRLLDELDNQFKLLQAPIGHVKLLLEGPAGYVLGNLTGSARQPLQGSAGNGTQAKLIVNARVQMDPSELEKTVQEALVKTGKNTLLAKTLAVKSLRPGRPQPTYRYDQVVPVQS